jgi:hypothetical protein
MSDLKRWRGLAALLQSAVENGSLAVERIQKDTAKVPFGILEQLPEIGPVARGAHLVHDVCVSGVHGSIRLVTRALGSGIGVALEIFDDPPDTLRRDETAARPPRGTDP